MSAQDYLNADQFGNSSDYYNNVPETRGISRTKSTYDAGGGTGLARADQEKLGTGRASAHKPSAGCMHCVRAGLVGNGDEHDYR